jgi:AcrR family transcriptional regulator
MPRSKEATRQSILDAAEAVLRKHGAPALTVGAVATGAECAKGLVTYHFQTKTKLLVESVLRLAAAREAVWIQAFDTPNPQDAIDRTWEVLKREAESGGLKAWTSLMALGDNEVDQAVNDSSSQFRSRITEATGGLLARAGLKTTIPAQQLGWLLAAVIQGMGFQVAGGGELDVLENAYAAVWLGLLSLTEPLD